MELVSTMEINGEEREIADAYAREKIATNAQNIATNAEGIAGLNNNLSQLELSDVAGGKNIINIPEHEYFNGITDTRNFFVATILIDEKLVGAKHINSIGRNNIEFSISNIGIQTIRLHHSGALADITLIEQPVYFDKTGNYTISFDVNGYNPSTVNGLSINKIQIEEGKATDYEPYIPSVKMLAEEVSAQNDSLEYYGFMNQFDGNVTYGYWYNKSNGEYQSSTTSTTITNKISCNGSDIIRVVCPSTTNVSIVFYDSSDTFIIGTDKDGTDVTFTAPPNVSYCRINFYKSGGFGGNIGNVSVYINNAIDELKSDLSDCCKKSDITTNETLIGTFNGKNYYRRLFTGISGSGGSVTVNVGEKIEIYNYYGRAYTYGQSGASDVKYPIPNKNYYIDSQNASETSFQLTIPTSSDTRKVDLVIEYTKVDE